MKTLFIPLLLILVACSGSPEQDPEVTLDVRLASAEMDSTMLPMRIDETGDIFFISRETIIDNRHVASAAVAIFEARHAVELRLNENGEEIISRISSDHVGEHLAFLVDGELVAAPRINAPLRGKRLMINGIFTQVEAGRIARGIK